MAKPTDREYVERTLGGDRDAFADLVGRHLRPSFGIAFALTQSDEAAEDVVRDAVLHAYRDLHRLARRDGFGAWFAAIVRNRAKHWLRQVERGRRARAEWRVRQRMTVTPDSHERFDDSEARDALNRRVALLPEPLRVPLILYYYDSQSTANVARRLDMTEATVRKRLQLARDRLRADIELDLERDAATRTPGPEFARRLRGAVLALPPLARSGLLGASSVACTGGVIVTSSKLWLVVVFAVCVLLGCALLWLADERPPDAGTADRATPSTALDVSAKATADQSEPAADAEPPNAIAERGAIVVSPLVTRIVGEVVDDENRGLAGVALHFIEPKSSPPAFDDPKRRASTDDDGHFTFDIPPGVWDVIARVDGYVTKTVSRVHVAPGESRTMWIALEHGLSIRGRVVSPDGGAVAQAEVRVLPKLIRTEAHGASVVLSDTNGSLSFDHLVARSDRAGRFVVSGVAAGEWRLRATHDAFASIVVEGVVAGRQDVVITMPIGSAVSGVVRNADRELIAGARVAFESDGIEQRSTVTDVSGRYRVEAVSRGTATVHISADGYAPLVRWGVLVQDAVASDVDFVLSRGVRIAGEIVDTEGHAISGARVWTRLRNDEETECTSDHVGRFAFEPFEDAQREFDLAVTHRDFARAELTWNVDVDGEGSITIVLERGVTIAGFVVDSLGQPMAGTRVEGRRATANEGPTPPRDECASAVTDADGRFRIGPLVEATWSLRATRSGYAPIEQLITGDELSSATAATLDGITIVLGRGSVFCGIVVDSNDRPLADVQLELSGVDGDEDCTAQSRSGADGRFEFRGLDDSTYELRARREDLIARRWSGLTCDPSAAEQRFELVRPARLIGVVVDGATGQPIPEFSVLVIDEREVERRSPDDLFGPGLSIADPAGRFRFDELEPGRATVVISAHGYATRELRRIQLDAGADRPVVLELDKGRSLSGRLVDGLGQPVTDAHVRLRRSDDIEAFDCEVPYAMIVVDDGMFAMPFSSPIGVATDREGRFCIEHFPRGRTAIVAAKAGYLDRRVDVPAVDRELGDIVLSRGAGCHGVLVLPDGIATDGGPVVGGLLSVRSKDGARVSRLPIAVGKGGIVDVWGYPPGHFELRLLNIGYEAAGETRFVTQRFRPIDVVFTEERDQNQVWRLRVDQ